MISADELKRRWSKLRDLLVESDTDAIVVSGGAATPDLIYLTNYKFRGATALFLLSRDGDTRLILRYPLALDLPRPDEPWLQTDGESDVVYEGMDARALPDSAIDWLKARDAARVAVNLSPGAPLVAELGASIPGAEAVPLAAELLALRFVKSEEELRIIRRSAEIADAIWAQAPDFIRPGRVAREIVADVHRLSMEAGADLPLDTYHGSLNLIFGHLPPTADGYVEEERVLENGYSFTLEISPRVHSYFSQLTSPVSVGPARPELKRLHECTMRATEAGLAQVRPGSDSAKAAQAMLAVIESEGLDPGNTDIGHLLGLDITEPRMGLNTVVEFEAGMTLVFHPIVKSAASSMYMRGDTYLVTDAGPERLNTAPQDLAEL
jgi:Xaa-Pro aminopeptidase